MATYYLQHESRKAVAIRERVTAGIFLLSIASDLWFVWRGTGLALASVSVAVTVYSAVGWFSARQDAAALAAAGGRCSVTVSAQGVRSVQPSEPITRRHSQTIMSLGLGVALALLAVAVRTGGMARFTKSLVGGLGLWVFSVWFKPLAGPQAVQPGVDHLRRSEITGFVVYPTWIEIRSADPHRRMRLSVRIERLIEFCDELSTLGIPEEHWPAPPEELGNMLRRAALGGSGLWVEDLVLWRKGVTWQHLLADLAACVGAAFAVAVTLRLYRRWRSRCAPPVAAPAA